MKNILHVVVIATVMILFFILLVVNNSYTMRDRETEESLNRAVYNVLDESSIQGKLASGSSDKELISEFTELLTAQLNTKNDKNFALTIDIYEVDSEKGLISLKVTEQFTYPNGKVGSCETTATIVLEQEISETTYTVTYTIPQDVLNKLNEINQKNLSVPDYSGELYGLPETYASYTITEGKTLIVPTNPPNFENYHFVTWVDAEGNVLDATSKVTKDTEYFATYTTL